MNVDFIEIYLFSRYSDELYLLQKNTKNIFDALDQIAAIQILNYDIAPYFEISVKEICEILKQEFGWAANLKDSHEVSNKKKIKNLALCDIHKELKNVNFKKHVIIEIELQNLWDYYTTKRYSENMLVKYTTNKDLFNVVKAYIINNNNSKHWIKA